MARCAECLAELEPSSPVCPRCHTAHSSDAHDETRLHSVDDRTRASGDARTPVPRTSSDGVAPAAGSGWLSSSGAIDHGRFPPGMLLGGRYRIVGRLGRGGMGEVYRADDLKLGQPVALKFLAPEVDQDPGRLTQLHTEVRMARQVSHPNVCRVYDIDEVDGHSFLSMEYVDGEDLASLLRRIGRFPVDRALEVARQVCAGLAAAHERGVVHRDFKPANVMIDGTGHVRITDFGLAGIAGETIGAGTPAYMAPEQLAGAEVTARSDIYALGLVLYELFTGRRAIEARNLAELVRRREEAAVVPPSQIVQELDPAIDRAVLRCLERTASDRPSSALAVSAALPGGDPVAAALAAGETPSPEMVAAGESEALRPLPAIAAFAAVVVAVLLTAALADRLSITALVPLTKPPDVLTDRAAQLVRQLGYAEPPADTAHGFGATSDYLTYVKDHPAEVTREVLASGRPAALHFWYRASPRSLVPQGENRLVLFDNPPLTVSGMISLVLDPDGRLLELAVVPPQVESPLTTGSPPAPDWDALFTAADLSRKDFTPATPAWTPGTHSDARAAWEGPMPGVPGMRLHLEAASYRGRPVFFQSIGPWTQPSRMANAPTAGSSRFWQAAAAAAVVLILGSAVLVARHNLRKGRGDRRSAIRVSGIILGTSIASWILGSVHFADLGTELDRVFDGIAQALFSAGVVWVLYIALEPYVRRFWPSTLTSWTRLLAGRWRDPLVGRDVLVGCVFGASVSLILPLYVLLVPYLGYSMPPGYVPRLSNLEGFRRIVATLGDATFGSFFNALWSLFGLVMLRLLLRRAWLSAVAAVLFFSVTSSVSDAGPPWLRGLLTLAVLAFIVFLVMRFGLLATLTFFSFDAVLGSTVLTLDPSKWFFPASAWILALGLALAGYGLYAARGGEPLLGRRILD